MRRDLRDDAAREETSDHWSKEADCRLREMALLAATAAHDAAGPLTYVLSNLEYLDAQLALHESELSAGRVSELRQCLREATLSAMHVRDIVRAIHAPRTTPLRESQVDLHRLLLSCIKVARTEIDHRARVITEFDAIPQLVGSEAHLRRVFLNLIINAAQAVAGDSENENFIRVVTRKTSDGNVVVEIADSGPGIPEETLPHVFEPFFTTKPAHEGAGLGLAVCRHVLNELGGNIEVETTLGRGATFRVALPVAPPSTVPPANTEARLTPSVPPVRRLPRRQLG
ncbi:MAG TPA: ATP-binding protein [Polyangiaceae bacterium]|jgi:signal transduction histidine kinase|nr:ATP-binding protein [Polyangiaceae bacterium]